MIQQQPSSLDASKLEIQLASDLSRPIPAHNSPEQWSQSCPTDHMLTCSWNLATGWSQPKIHPYTNLSLQPISSVLNYATTCFEGMKCYRGYDGKARLFRPNMNAARMLRSAERICLPSFDPSELEKLMVQFASVEAARWCPVDRPGTFYYLRPVMIATQGTLGLQAPREALLYIVAVACPNIDDTPITTVVTQPGIVATDSQSESANKEHTFMTTAAADSKPGLTLLAASGRAWPNGPGSSKVGANYGPTLLISEQARAKSFDQVLWLYDGPSHETNPLVTEAGGCNLFVVLKTQAGKHQLLTAGLEKGLVLPGVTRSSILDLAREEWGQDELEVKECDFGIKDLITASEEGRFVEAFVAGTAYFVTPVRMLSWNGVEVEVPVADKAGGKYTSAIREFLLGVQYGRRDHKWGVVLQES